mmetsp:Transcript_52714/g.171419  ORF Transcript_52714/g.171419 Transcript_52714/m.171419 type:complete len:331 (-) Transcript_52714:849-1841(-)
MGRALHLHCWRCTRPPSRSEHEHAEEVPEHNAAGDDGSGPTQCADHVVEHGMCKDTLGGRTMHHFVIVLQPKEGTTQEERVVTSSLQQTKGEAVPDAGRLVREAAEEGVASTEFFVGERRARSGLEREPHGPLDTVARRAQHQEQAAALCNPGGIRSCCEHGQREQHCEGHRQGGSLRRSPRGSAGCVEHCRADRKHRKVIHGAPQQQRVEGQDGSPVHGMPSGVGDRKLPAHAVRDCHRKTEHAIGARLRRCPRADDHARGEGRQLQAARQRGNDGVDELARGEAIHVDTDSEERKEPQVEQSGAAGATAQSNEATAESEAGESCAEAR